VPAGSAYSVDGVKRRRGEEEAASLVARNLKLRDNRIRRPAILQDPLLGGSLAREYGHKEFVDSAVRTYTQGWDAKEILQAEHVDALNGPPIPRQHVNSTQTIAAFDFDPVTRTLFCRKSYLPYNYSYCVSFDTLWFSEAPPSNLFLHC
jgi:hypothetical protein